MGVVFILFSFSLSLSPNLLKYELCGKSDTEIFFWTVTNELLTCRIFLQFQTQILCHFLVRRQCTLIKSVIANLHLVRDFFCLQEGKCIFANFVPWGGIWSECGMNVQLGAFPKVNGTIKSEMQLLPKPILSVYSVVCLHKIWHSHSLPCNYLWSVLSIVIVWLCIIIFAIWKLHIFHLWGCIICWMEYFITKEFYSL